MLRSTDVPPDIDRPDVGTVLVSRFDVSTPESQQTAAEISLDKWKSSPSPNGCLSFTCFESTDGESVLHYSQWDSEEAVREFTRTEYSRRTHESSELTPEIEHVDSVEYRLYRSNVADESQHPACIVVVTIEFDGPDRERAREWVDAMFDVEAPENEAIPGLLAAHFHVSTDGSRALNYAEWTSEEAHMKMIEGASADAEGDTESDRDSDRHEIEGFDVQRYRLYRSFSSQ